MRFRKVLEYSRLSRAFFEENQRSVPHREDYRFSVRNGPLLGEERVICR